MARTARALIAAAAVIALFAAGSGAQALHEHVGDLADPERIRIEGNTTFSDDAIRRGLLDDTGVLLALRPQGARTTLLTELTVAAVEGYRHAGFPEARAAARVTGEPAAIEVTIAEGPRFTAGRVRIEGFPGRLEPAVRRALTGGEEGAPLWSVGEPGPLDRCTRQSVVAAVRECLDRAGLMSARFRVRVIPVERDRTAELRVALTEAGPPTRIGEIRLFGRIRPQTRRVMRAFLGIAEGMPLDRDLIDTAQRKLRESGRFLRERVWSDPPDASGGAPLSIEVIETDAVSVLTTSPDACERALRALVGWCQKIEQTDAVLIGNVEVRSIRAEVIWSPKAGVIADFDFSAVENLGIRSGTVAFTHDATILIVNANGVERAVRTGPLPHLQPIIRLQTNASDEGGPFTLRLAVGTSSDGDEPEGWSRLVEVHPGPILSLHGGTYTEKEGVAEVVNGGARLRMRPETGALLTFEMPFGDQGGGIEVQAEAGTFSDHFTDVAAIAAASEQAAGRRVDRAVRAACLVAEQILVPLAARARGKPELAPAAAAAARRVTAAVVPHLVAEYAKIERKHDEKDGPEFVVPFDATNDVEAAALRRALLPGVKPSLASWAATFLFPRDTWPAVFTREALHLVAGHRDGVPQELRRILKRGRIGPIGCLIAAAIPAFPAAERRAYAAHGLRNLDLAAFRRDCEVLIFATGRSAVSRAAIVSLRSLRDAAPDEARGLAEITGPDAGRLLLECHAALRDAPAVADPAATLRPVLDRAWETWLQDRVKTALEAVLR